MNNIIVKKDIEELGLEIGDLLFYRPNENLYERIRRDSIKKEGLEYILNESLKYSKEYLQEYLDNKSMIEYLDVLRNYYHVDFEEASKTYPYYEEVIDRMLGLRPIGLNNKENFIK